GSPSDTDAVAAVRAALAPREPQIRAAIARLEALRDMLPVRHRVDVLCHTDIWGSNLLRSGDGTLHLLDWNGALIGPPEHDLFMFAGTWFFPAQRFGWFLDHYEAALRTLRGQPVARPDPAILGFYLYRRNLEDLAAWAGSVLDDEMEALGPATTLRVIDGLLAETPQIEGRIEYIRALLADRTGTEPEA
ncbi:MAG: phosphotransferase, partial [Candidatus Limnocylindrales bacterium]